MLTESGERKDVNTYKDNSYQDNTYDVSNMLFLVWFEQHQDSFTGTRCML